MTLGYMAPTGQDKKAGLDGKFVLHYDARMRFVTTLLPSLKTAAQGTSVAADARLSRVVSVLDPHVVIRPSGAELLNSDLNLNSTFNLATSGVHASLMGGFFLEFMALQEEGHLFAATNAKLPPKFDGDSMEGDVAVGSDGIRGSGSYWAYWESVVFLPNTSLYKIRAEVAMRKVGQHTHEVFQRVWCEEISLIVRGGL
ncbi:hypothetical protein N7448_002304 [Penicillium atrosanguineum]|uniref:Uncharacterized protein n=1 Tax=Penicillium atrosanguineum TaxID=1132637 RepID=A0A9W9LA79_9EURO|nr:uncharacterized protein N7443_005708 [Penicillium atrosanguineum]KAJ5128587.1 hypothetical protein N7526_006753 [Penicillium atrosanguineum]KAJ5144912.1 hypothetical protein N7448_002304 [Penicillium atrosanguineum]KAJ5300706.1 hypothetical protein N7443_005708 [Penicillium atrosanguineum]KAJ5311347.1 hypothetical protein N7476_007207 [Penicillium atrosanguineum]